MTRTLKRARADIEPVTETCETVESDDVDQEIETTKDIDLLQEHGIVSSFFILNNFKYLTHLFLECFGYKKAESCRNLHNKRNCNSYETKADRNKGHDRIQSR